MEYVEMVILKEDQLERALFEDGSIIDLLEGMPKEKPRAKANALRKTLLVASRRADAPGVPVNSSYIDNIICAILEYLTWDVRYLGAFEFIEDIVGKDEPFVTEEDEEIVLMYEPRLREAFNKNCSFDCAVAHKIEAMKKDTFEAFLRFFIFQEGANNRYLSIIFQKLYLLELVSKKDFLIRLATWINYDFVNLEVES